jgi:hypothetical protein
MIAQRLIAAVLLLGCCVLPATAQDGVGLAAAEAGAVQAVPGVPGSPGVGSVRPAGRPAQRSATLTLSAAQIILDTQVPIYALQFSVLGCGGTACVLGPTSALQGFAIAQSLVDQKTNVIVYNLAGLTIPAGRHVIFDVDAAAGVTLADVLLSDRAGALVPTAVTGVPAVPYQSVLLGNYPNPFNPVTHIRYNLADRSRAVVSIFDILGRPVRTLDADLRESGSHVLQWDGTDDSGREVQSGVYLCRLRADGYEGVVKMLLLR